MTPERAAVLLAASQMDVLPKEYAAVFCNLSEDTLERAASRLELEYSKQYSRLFFEKNALNNFMRGMGKEPASAPKKRAAKTAT
jgi:ribosomal protein L22